MPHSNHGKRSSELQKLPESNRHNKQGRHKAKSQSKEAVKSLPAKGGQEAQQEPLVEKPRPWSRWFPGDNGKWFYQGRLKADGSGWEYQFTEGYPPSTRRDRIVYGSLDAVTPYCEAPQTTVSYASATEPTVATAAPISAPAAQLPTVAATADDADDATSLTTDEVSTTVSIPYEYQTSNAIAAEEQPQVAVAALPATRSRHTTTRANTPAPHRPSKKNHAGSRAAATETRSVKATSSKQNKKKLSAIVNAEKELRFNSKKKVKGWLSEVGD